MGSERKNDHQNAEILTGNAIPKNSTEKSASTDYAVEKVVTGKDPIPTSTPDWAKDLPKPK